jgi:hypothetical protein
LRPAFQPFFIFLLAMLASNRVLSQSAKPSENNSEVAIITAVQVVQNHGSPALEIDSTQPVVPKIQSTDSPPQLVIEIPNARSGLQKKRMDVLQQNILIIRIEQNRKTPPSLRIVLQLLVPYSYSLENAGNRLMITLKPPEDPYVAAREAPAPVQPPQAVSTPGGTPAVVPVTSGIGQVLVAGRSFAAGSSLTAGADTAVLQLARGGEVRVCPGTTLSITPSKGAKELMMGLSTGGMETNYGIGAFADTVLTPDFRILLAGPGEFHFAISTDAQGTTCVRGLHGNASSALVSELIGDRVYQVKPNEQAVFHSGQIDKVDTNVPLECGCPPPREPVTQTEVSSPQVAPDSGSQNLTLAPPGNPQPAEPASASRTLSQPTADAHQTLSNGPETMPLPPGEKDQVHVQVEAPLVFHGTNSSSAPDPPFAEARALPVLETTDRPATLSLQALPPADAKPQHHGVFARIKGFFAAIFH